MKSRFRVHRKGSDLFIVKKHPYSKNRFINRYSLCSKTREFLLSTDLQLSKVDLGEFVYNAIKLAPGYKQLL